MQALKPSATKGELIAWCRTQGYHVWVNVLYYPMAVKVCGRLKAEAPQTDPSIGLMDDDTYVVWYKPDKAPWALEAAAV
jgi:hypothetical protein